MPWWSWALIWTGLALILLAVLGWFAVALYRKSLGTLSAVVALSDRVSSVDLDLPLGSAPFTAAVFADSAELVRKVEQHRVERTHRRQLRRDARIMRGKLIPNAR
ncbi:MAG: alkaline shock response membrane anchor protein AmaP [Cryobacterium sp.]|uniref:hypothetical protein n=1 Tax=Cryobacterium sp. TaxID=1926290 RepID=UPI00229237E3|nr:hypothetical protein [Cryobacterium sp.]MCY7404360.1 alkaline shock response membrane anchor protein AmaP [Cryobacterium sp.]